MLNERNTTDSNRVYKRAHKSYVAQKYGKCAYCGWHRGENAGRKQRSWKKFRRTQYRRTIAK